MSFYNRIVRLNETNFKNIFEKFTDSDVLQAVNSRNLNENDFLALLSPKAQNRIEEIAQKSQQLTLHNFGRVIHLYTPVYLSSHCKNKCLYCGFNTDNKIERRQLTLAELEKEAKIIAKTDLKNIIILTGEDRNKTPVSYIKNCIEILRNYFTSISIEIYPLTQAQYDELIKAGLDGLTIYQETYDLNLYKKLHFKCPKSDFKFRLDAPENAAKAGIRQISTGALLGLSNWRKDIFITALHTKYLEDKYPKTEFSISLPRLRPHKGKYTRFKKVTAKDMVQIIAALRIFMPKAGINISTREDATLRENLIPLGVTKMSAGVSTAVGGRMKKTKSAQFEISDIRSVVEMKKVILKKGYQPVLHDWAKI